jgi:hypothetical protein
MNARLTNTAEKPKKARQPTRGVTASKAQLDAELRSLKKKAYRKVRGLSARAKRDVEEMPPIDFDKAVVLGRGAEGLEKGLDWLRRGRPKKGETAEGTSVKSVRLPNETWAELERLAKQRKVSLHALLRAAIAKLLAA